ncbi:serine/threonine-protein kinase Nek11-like isoform X2 [Pseudophryne corroboree]|uniref:serine/threonine-protein kinase Nek11-like isoform X2 n=1 Tax=Pseudophryne corroboree TaxID=495146 RepID=UPI003082125A
MGNREQTRNSPEAYHISLQGGYFLLSDADAINDPTCENLNGLFHTCHLRLNLPGSLLSSAALQVKMDMPVDKRRSPIMYPSGFSPGSLLMKRYKVHRKLDSGSFATTYLVTDVKDAENQKVIKRIPFGNVKADATLPSAREAKLLGSLRHPLIVQFLGSFLENDDFCIVTEYCEGGDLHCHIQKQRDRGLAFTEGHVMEWFIQLLLGVNYLHERSVMHRDLKTKNIFLKNGTLKIGDFGVSRILVSSDMATTFTGTASYMSPEVFSNEGYNTKSDIWSLGCILYEMCALKRAFDCPRWIKLISMIVNDPCPSLPSEYSAELNDILQRMLMKDPDLRPGARDVLNYPYVTNKVKVLSEWLQEVILQDRQNSVNEDASRIAAAMQEKLHLDSLRAMRLVQEMPPRQRRRIRQEEHPETNMKKLKRAVDRVYQENQQKVEQQRRDEANEDGWEEKTTHLSDGEQKGVCSDEVDSDEDDSLACSVLTISLPMSEQQSSTLRAYQSYLQRFLDSSTETGAAAAAAGIQDTFPQESEDTILSVCSKQEIVHLRHSAGLPHTRGKRPCKVPAFYTPDVIPCGIQCTSQKEI